MNSQNNTNGQIIPTGTNQSMIQVMGQVTNDDIVSVLVARHEEAQNLRKLQGERDMRNIQAEITSINKALADIGPEVCKTIDSSSAGVVAAQLNNGGFGAFEAKVTLNGINNDGNAWNFLVSVVKKADPKKHYEVDESIACKEVVAPFTQEAVNLTARLKAKQAELVNIQNELLEVKRSLSDIPTLQRRARAKLAEMALNKTAEGQEILAGILGTKALPHEL